MKEAAKVDRDAPLARMLEQGRPSARVPDWAAAATEARQRRDEAGKQLAQQRRQAREAAAAWSPQYEIRALAGALGKAAGVVMTTTVPTPGVPAPSGSPTPQPQPPSRFKRVTGQPARRVRAPNPRPPGEPSEMPQQVLNARALKCTVVLEPAEVAQLVAPDGQLRVVLAIRLPDRRVTADVAAKSVRRALATIAEHGPDGVAVVVQGKLVADSITEAGLMAQPKARPQAAAEAA